MNGDGIELQLFRLEHAPVIYDLIDKNRAHLREWLPWVDGVTEPEDTLDFVKRSIELYEKGLGPHYAIHYYGVLVGLIGFQPIHWSDKKAEIGYWLSKKYCGKGIMTWCTGELIRIGFEELRLNKIKIHCASGNKSSKAIPERLGLVYEGLLRSEQCLYGEFVDLLAYSILKSEYR